jgi:hypothetical protein
MVKEHYAVSRSLAQTERSLVGLHSVPGLRPVIMETRDHFLEIPEMTGVRFRFMFLDGDEFADKHSLIAHCLDLRLAAPDVPLILCLGDLRLSDFTTERLAICDVTLRRPLSTPSLLVSLDHALANNLEFRSRSAVRPWLAATSPIPAETGARASRAAIRAA